MWLENQCAAFSCSFNQYRMHFQMIDSSFCNEYRSGESGEWHFVRETSASKISDYGSSYGKTTMQLLNRPSEYLIIPDKRHYSLTHLLFNEHWYWVDIVIICYVDRSVIFVFISSWLLIYTSPNWVGERKFSTEDSSVDMKIFSEEPERDFSWREFLARWEKSHRGCHADKIFRGLRVWKVVA